MPLPGALYKSKLCRNWTAAGTCALGARCHFAHGEHELRAPNGGDAGGGAAYSGGGYGGGAAAAAVYYQQPLSPTSHAASGAGGGAAGAVTDDIYARQGFPVLGPNGWVSYRTQDTGEIYWHNHATSVTQWTRPAEWPSAP